jgi:two-component system NtrC family response regulator
MPEHHLLVVDDEESQRTVLAGFLRKRGFRVTTAASVPEAVRTVEREAVDLVITDVRMPGASGIELLEAVRRINPEVGVVLLTAFGTVADAVGAMKLGAADYLTKPVDLDELEIVVARVLERRALHSENRELRRVLEARHGLQGLQTANTRMAEALSTAARAAPSRATVLVRGESGTGKELIARAIHLASPRAASPFVSLNVAALPETLVESELFGHERGAFTGADRERHGRFELADGGTLLLDEIGDLPPGAQVKLLRVLQEQSFERLGGSRTIRVDVRVLAATHRDLESLVRDGRFREDLYYRLNVVTVHLPALRDRREDIPALVAQFLERYGRERERPPRAFSREAMDALVRYAYPGNVRELENIVQRAVVLAREPLITTADLPPHLVGLGSERQGERLDAAGSFVERVAAFERRLIIDALDAAGGVQTRAARALGMSERHLRYKLKKFGLESTARDA